MPEILEKTRACVFSPTTTTIARRFVLFMILSKQVIFKRLQGKIVQVNAFYELYVKENERSLGPEIRLFRKNRHKSPSGWLLLAFLRFSVRILLRILCPSALLALM